MADHNWREGLAQSHQRGFVTARYIDPRELKSLQKALSSLSKKRDSTMADKLIRVNSRVSVMASQVAYVIAPEFQERIEVHLLDGRVEELEYSMRNERWRAKDRFETAVNDALKGE